MKEIDANAPKVLDWLEQERGRMRQEFNRVLPTNELFFNRFEKARFLHAGANSSAYDSSVIMGDVEIGDNVWIGPYTLLEGINGTLIIGDYVTINAGVSIVTHDSTKYYISGGKIPFKKGNVAIGSNSVIGTMSMIGPGVSIGSHCVVAAHSVVTSNVPDNMIVAGVPAKPIGVVEIDGDTVEFKYHGKEGQ